MFIDEHMKSADAGLPVGQERTVSLGGLLVEVIATIVDRPGGVGPVRLLECEDRRFVISAKPLQLEGRDSDRLQSTLSSVIGRSRTRRPVAS
jgi:hypothetical protein